MTGATNRSSARRAELLRIAGELFARHGYANVTVDDIGAAAGVSGPALYHHFAGKEALLGEMLVGISEYLLAGGREVVVSHRGSSDACEIESLVRFHAGFAVDDRSLITVQTRDLVHAAASDRARVTALQSRYASLWVEAVRRRWPDVERRRAQAAVHGVFGLLNSTPHSGRLARGEMIEMLSSMASRALSAAAAAPTTSATEK